MITNNHAMPNMHVAFQEGFENDTVIVWFDDDEVFRKEHLKTRMQTGKAASFDLPGKTGPHILRITVINRNTHLNIPVTVSGTDLYVGISLTQDGHITHTLSNEPFRYA
ncbi:hypothetical protein [Longitalea arenae]|uniref:hypothetical protein n=1 Tax=Longitalea arenae TaxID=2812558 RepID=UPI0019685EBC|nr:hypothetical protein [Longitalea arenae]